MSPLHPYAGVNFSDLPEGVMRSPRYFYEYGPDGRCYIWPPVNYTFPESGVVAGITVYVLSLTFIWTTMFLYVARRNHSYLKKRAPVPLLVITSLGGSFMALAAIQQGMRSVQQWPCLINLLYFLIIPCWIAPLTVRFVSAANRVHFYEIANAASLVDLDDAMERLTIRTPRQNFATVVMLSCNRRHMSPLDRTIVQGLVLGQIVVDLIVLPFIVLILYLLATEDVFKLNCYGCFDNQFEEIFLISTLLFIGLTGLVLLKFRNMQDPLGELREIKVCFIITAVFAGSGEILSSLPLSNALALQGFTFNYLILVGYLLMHGFMVVLPYLRTLRKFNVEDGGIDVVLADPALKATYADFLKKEMSFENIKFLDEVSHFKLEHANDSPSAHLAKARRLVTAMVSDGGLLQVNLPSEMRVRLDKAVGKEAVDADVDLFDQAYAEIKRLMERDSFPRFKIHLVKTQGNVSFGPAKRGSKASMAVESQAIESDDA